MAIFILLALGIVGLPVPDEVIMTIIGYYTHTEALSYQMAMIASFLGAVIGMLISYTIGRKFGRNVIKKYGKWFGLKESRLNKVELWMKKYGAFALVFGYFIPGVRHITCYVSGIGKMNVKIYLLFASLGAFSWCGTFILIGRYIGVIGT